MINIKPIKGKMVIDPETSKAMPEKGIYVKKVSQYWKNREKDGDVTIKKLKQTKEGK